LKKSILITLLSLLIFTGCGTLTKEIHVEMNKPIKITKPSKIVALVTAKNANQVDLDIVSKLADKLQKKGVTITSNPLEADYTIALSVPTQQKLVDEDGNIIGLSALSTGLASAAVAYRVTGGSGSSALGAGLAGAAGGALLGYVLKDSSLALKLDVVFAQNKLNPIITQKTRIFSTVRQMHLNKADAQIVLVDKLSTEIANLF